MNMPTTIRRFQRSEGPSFQAIRQTAIRSVRSQWLLAILTLALSAGAASAATCSVNGPVSIEDEYARSLFVAEVVVIKTGPYRDMPNQYRGKTITDEERTIRFRLSRAWKGDPGREFTIQDSNTSARLAVDVGDRLLVFIGSHGPGAHYVNVCGNSEYLDRLPTGVLPALKALAGL